MEYPKKGTVLWILPIFYIANVTHSTTVEVLVCGTLHVQRWCFGVGSKLMQCAPDQASLCDKLTMRIGQTECTKCYGKPSEDISVTTIKENLKTVIGFSSTNTAWVLGLAWKQFQVFPLKKDQETGTDTKFLILKMEFLTEGSNVPSL